jgi:hypothetical protein
VQELINAVELSHRESRWVSLPLPRAEENGVVAEAKAAVTRA